MATLKVLMFGFLVWAVIVCMSSTPKAYANTCPFHSNIFNSTGKSSDVCYANVDYQGTLSNQYHSSYPVNLLSGNKHLTETDIYPQNINGQIGLEFTRYYNSMSSHKGMLGYGWRTLYEPQLLDRGNTLSLIQPDGTQFHFHLATDTKDGYKTDRYISNNPEYGYFVKISKGGLVEWQWYRPSGQRFTFIIDSRYMTAKETLGKLSKIVANHREPNSDYIQVIYDKNHKIAQVVDSLGQKLIFNYQNKKVILRFNGITHTYYQDDKHNLIGYTDSEGNAFNYHYDNKEFPHSLTKKTLISDDETQILGNWRYDDKGRVDYEELPNKKKSLTITYDPKAPTSKQDIAYENGTKHYTTTTINGLGEVVKYIFTITGGFYELIDKQYENCQSCDGLSMQKTDEQGNVAKRIIGDTTYFYTYDNQSRLTLIEVQSKDTPKQWQQKRQYVGDGRLPSQIIRPSTAPNKEHTLSITYNQYGQPTYIKEMGYRNSSTGIYKIVRDYRYEYKIINGKSKLIAFDGALAGEKDKIRYHYDDKGQLIAIYYPKHLSQSIQYDELGRVAIFTDLGNLIYQYQYDTKGNIIKSDEAGKVRHIKYNALGKPTKITDDGGQTLVYHYDKSGALIGLSDDKSTKIEFVRDVENGLVSARLIDKKSGNHIEITQKDELLSVEAFGNLVQELPRKTAYNNFLSKWHVLDNWLNDFPTQTLIDNKGESTSVYFDDFGKVSEENSPITAKTSYDWDMLGNLNIITNQNGQIIKFIRDGFGDIIQITDDDGDTDLQWSDGKLTAATHKDYHLLFEYGDNNQIIKKSYILDGHPFNVLYHYDDNGKLSEITYPSGMRLGYDYDIDGKLRQIYKNGLIIKKPLIDKFNQLIKDNKTYEQSFVFGNGIKQVHSYDKMGLPTMVGSQNLAYSQSISYDNGHTIDYHYANDINALADNEKSNKIESNTPATYLAQSTTPNDEYDALGQLVAQNDHRYEYDSQGRLVKFFKNGEPITSYAYLYTGERYKKVSYQNGQPTHTTYYLYDNGILLAEVHQDNHQQWQYTEYLHLGVRPVIQFNNKTPYYLTTDHRGAVMVATDDKKNIVWQANLTDNGYANITKQDITINLRGSNQYYDKDSDLHYNIHRYFDPQRNQYLTPDPLGITVGDDLYAFAHNRPHEYVDLWGLAPENEYALLGTKVHSIFAMHIRSKSPFGSWGGQDARLIAGLGSTWPTGLGGLLPDAYHVTPLNLLNEKAKKSFVGSVWELKPISYLHDQKKYQSAKNQLQGYIDNAKRGTWSAGCNTMISIAPQEFLWQGRKKQVSFINDFVPKAHIGKRQLDEPSGLIFYAIKDIKEDSSKKPKEQVAEELVKAPESSKLRQIINDIQDGLTNLSPVAKIGIAVLIIAAVVAIAYFGGVGAAIAAAISSLAWALRSGVAILTALSAVLGTTANAATAEKEGEKQQKGLLDKMYDKFKSWFK